MLKINLLWDANALAAPQSFRDGVSAAATILQNAIYDSITVNIGIGYGEYDDGGPDYQTLTFFSLGGVDTGVEVSYAALRAILVSTAITPSQAEAANSLPATTTLNGQSSFDISDALAKAFGALPATSSEVDGYAGFPTSFTGTSLISTAIVELVHAMGLLNSGFPLSLFEYTSPSSHLLTEGSGSTPAYFSIDGGYTNLASYAVGYDSTLFSNKPGDVLSFPTPGVTVLSALDLMELGAIGFNVSGNAALPAQSFAQAASGDGWPEISTQSATIPEGAAVPVTSFVTAVSVPAGDSIATYALYNVGGNGGYFLLDGVPQPNGQWLTVLSSQLNRVDYVGGGTAGSESLTIEAIDGITGLGASSSLTVTTAAPSAPILANTTNGQSYAYIYDPASNAFEIIIEYSAPNASGTVLSTVVDATDGTSLVYAYSPTASVVETAQRWSGTAPQSGAPAGALLSSVVDDANGQSLVYAYQPTNAVIQTTQRWSATDPSNGAPAGSEISEVVDNVDGTSLLYAYNPTPSVVETIATYSGTNATDGAPQGHEISAIVDNANGTAILYVYQPTNTINLTVSFYASYDAATGAPTGAPEGQKTYYTDGAIATTPGTAATMATAILGNAAGLPITSAAVASSQLSLGTASAISGSTVPANLSALAVLQSHTLIDPGNAGGALRFMSGTSGDTLALHAGAEESVWGFDPAVGDRLDVASLFAEAGIGPIDTLSGFLSVHNVQGAAEILFDPTGHGAGAPVALLFGDGSLAAGGLASVILPPGLLSS